MASTETMEKRPIEPALHQVQNSWSPYSRASSSARARLRRWWTRLGFNHDTASKVRYEADMAMLRARCAFNPSHRRQVSDIASRRDLLVHLGCGNALLPGWINVDCYPPPPARGVEILTVDVRRGLPFADASVSAVFSEHFLEHLPVDTVRSIILPEVRRILAPGARVRIGVPDGEYFINQYIACRSGRPSAVFEAQRDGKTPMTMLNEIAHGYGHYFAYDFDTMSALLIGAGFRQVSRHAPFESGVAHFKDKDRRDAWRNEMTLYVEAETPSSPG